jgi:hypothetical protein
MSLIESIGEFSVIFFNNNVSHIIQQLPECGGVAGVNRSTMLNEEGMELVYKALNAIPFKETLLYGRCDL